MNLSLIFDRFKYKAFLISLLTLRFPPVYILPSLRSPFLTTQSIARLIFLLLFVTEIYLSLKGKGSLSDFINKNRKLAILMLIFLFELSFGIIYTVNIKEFLLRYKDVYISFGIFFLAGLYLKKFEGFAKVILLGLVLNLIYQALLFFTPGLFKSIAGLILYEKHLNLVLYNIERGRVYIETFDESFLLVFLAWAVNKFPKKGRLLSLILFTAVGFFALISNFRTRALVFVISIAGYLVYEIKKSDKRFVVKRMMLLASFLFAVAIFAEGLSLKLHGFSYIDRFALADREIALETIYFRFEQIDYAWSLSKANFLTGVGLGNFFDSLSFTKAYPQFFYLDRFQTVFAAAEYVHNIFGSFLAEAGIVGTVIFFVLTLKFIRDDWLIYKKGNKENILLISAFWGIYAYAMFNPFVSLSLQGSFWLLRGMLAARS